MVRMAAEVRPVYPSDWLAFVAVPAKLGMARQRRYGMGPSGRSGRQAVAGVTHEEPADSYLASAHALSALHTQQHPE